MDHRIVFLDRDTLGPGVHVRRPNIPHQWHEFADTPAHECAERLAEASIAITNKVKLDASLLETLPKLQMIAIAATGTNVVDLEAAQRRGIVVSNIRAYATTSVPEHVFMLMLALKRSLLGYADDIQAGEWQRRGQFCFFTHPINDLAGLRLGIFGRGTLGRAVARIAQAFAMDVVFAGRKGTAQPPAPYLPFAEVIASADILSLHCPLTPETHNLLTYAEFEQMKKRPIIINTARGGIIHEGDLARALRAGLISGAGIDVVSTEPPPPDHPFHDLAGRPDFILTPHIAWGSQEARQSLADQLIDNIEHFARGTPRNLCTPTGAPPGTCS